MEYNITVTDNAVKKILSLLKTEPDLKFRISVDGGGCSGFKYNYDLVKDYKDNDLIIKKGTAEVLIDDLSQSFMKDCIIDYVETLGNANFEIKNPNATVKCGCGNSFSL